MHLTKNICRAGLLGLCLGYARPPHMVAPRPTDDARTLLSSYHLVRRLGRRIGIDDSHNHVHSKEVLHWATEILRRLDKDDREELSRIGRLRIGHCAILHDLLDQKYDTALSVKDEVGLHLAQWFPDPQSQQMIDVMESISYSKTVRTGEDGNRSVEFPLWVRDHPEWSQVYHIVREADLLAAYNLARMVEYRRCRFPDLSIDEIRADMRSLFDRRIRTMVDDGLFVHRPVADLAAVLNEIAVLRMEHVDDMDLEKDHHLQMLRIIDARLLSGGRVIRRFMEMPVD